MTKYLTNDGHQYEAETAAELVAMMHEMCFHQEADDAAWMKDQAEHLTKQFGQQIRCGSAEEFVADLIKTGFIKVSK